MLYTVCPKEWKIANGQKGGKRKAKEIPSLHFLEKNIGTNNKPKCLSLPRRKQCGNSQEGFVKDRWWEELAAEQQPHTSAFAGLLTAPQLPQDHPTTGQENNPPMPPHQRVGVPRGCARGWAGSASPLAKPAMGWRRSLPNLQAVQTGCKTLQGTGLGFKWILIKWWY